MVRTVARTVICSIATFAVSAALAAADVHGPAPNLESSIDRPLRYTPDGEDFVITNGSEFFNRSLYGPNTAFRIDGGDRPEFLLYLPGRGGNLRFGVSKGGRSLWLSEMASVETRYRPGELVYSCKDPILGEGSELRIKVVAHSRTEGLLANVACSDLPAGLELFWAFGGVSGKRGSRDGDIGTEKVPISEYFQLDPEVCQGNELSLSGNAFTTRGKSATLYGVVPEGSSLSEADASEWNQPKAMLSERTTAGGSRPLLLGRLPLVSRASLFFSIQRLADNSGPVQDLDTYREVSAPPKSGRPKPKPYALSAPVRYGDLSGLFADSEARASSIRSRVKVSTPDPYLDAAVGALNCAADAVWDVSKDDIMHGAIAWRTRLLGWRGPYLLDSLGWHDRASSHFYSWARQQNVGPVSPVITTPDESSNLARSERGLHSNGDLSNSHYDMNLVYIDALFRHLLWTGDVEMAKRLWPTIERHIAWERRLFRREFGPEKLPLYEAYAVIWASDNLQYEGGGAAHSSAYNAYHNHMAARIARLVGADPQPYDTEAALIERAMRSLLWVPERGAFAEYKDFLGLQLVHPSAAAWTFYHTVDSEVPTAEEGLQMARAVDRGLPHIPVRGPGVPAGLHVVATSDWMPYEWSLNNVVMAESMHTALGFWQVGRPEEAWRLAKGSLLACMYMGISPGNVGSMSYLDVYRRESQRDFADGSGVLSRALVEGLFGVRPDLLAGSMTWMPGFPVGWDHASMSHPDFTASFVRQGLTDRYRFDSRFGRPVSLSLQLRASTRLVRAVTVNGANVRARPLSVLGAVDGLEIAAPPAESFDIVIDWSGRPSIPEEDQSPPDWNPPGPVGIPPVKPTGTLDALDLSGAFNDRVTNIFRNEYRSPRSPFVSLSLPKQGLGGWAGAVNDHASIDDSGVRLLSLKGRGFLDLPSGVRFRTPADSSSNNVVFVSRWSNYPSSVALPLSGKARRLFLLMAGSTNPMQSRIDNAEVVVTYVSGPSSRLALRNPENWWPIERDLFIDDYQFRFPGALPERLDLATGKVRDLDPVLFKGRGGSVKGGSAIVLSEDLDSNRPLRSIEVRALANDVVVGLMAATLER